MHSYKDFIVWQKSVVLAKQIYGVVQLLPASESFGLSIQLRRAAVSIVSNIAEGFSRKSLKENRQFLTVAFGSSSEIEAQLVLVEELGMIDRQKLFEPRSVLAEVREILTVLLKKFESKL